MSDFPSLKSDPGDVPPVVVLVHGTWGRGFIPGLLKKVAGWCDEGSNLRKVCRDTLGDETVFEPFAWSGANSPTARLNASENLKIRLEEIKEKHPSARIYLITHSHGGNVAMYCMKDKQSRQSIAGLVCFSTPFIHVSTREYGKSAGIVHKVMTALTLIVFIAALVFVTYKNFQLPPVWETVKWLAFALLAFSMWKFLDNGFGNIGSWSRKLASKLSIPDELPFPVLLVRDTGDEASSLLGAPQFMSSVVSLFLNILVALLHLANNARQWASTWETPNIFFWWGGTVLSLIVWFMIIDSFGGDPDSWYGFLPVVPYMLVLIRTYALWLLVILCAVLAFPCFILIYLFILVLSILLIPFGWQFAAAGASLKITAEATPPGEWGIVQLGPAHEAAGDSGMQHSTHSDPEALVILGDWFARVSNPAR